jgi:hypothetical protein
MKIIHAVAEAEINALKIEEGLCFFIVLAFFFTRLVQTMQYPSLS